MFYECQCYDFKNNYFGFSDLLISNERKLQESSVFNTFKPRKAIISSTLMIR